MLVDEYQDTNVLQARILRGLCKTHNNVRSSEMTPRASTRSAAQAFATSSTSRSQFANAHLVTLEQNYRSVQPILDTTNTLIARARERHSKVLWTDRTGGERPWLVTARDEEEQTTFVVDRILELYEAGTPFREMAVLFRAGYMSAAIEIELDEPQDPVREMGRPPLPRSCPRERRRSHSSACSRIRGTR